MSKSPLGWKDKYITYVELTIYNNTEKKRWPWLSSILISFSRIENILFIIVLQN